MENQNLDLGKGRPCAGKCAKPIYGLGYTCQKCGTIFCGVCSDRERWKCLKCGNQLIIDAKPAENTRENV